jgi:hypothetical protein
LIEPNVSALYAPNSTLGPERRGNRFRRFARRCGDGRSRQPDTGQSASSDRQGVVGRTLDNMVSPKLANNSEAAFVKPKIAPTVPEIW